MLHRKVLFSSPFDYKCRGVVYTSEGVGKRSPKTRGRTRSCGTTTRFFFFFCSRKTSSACCRRRQDVGEGGPPQIGCTGAYAAAPRKDHRGNDSQAHDLPLPLGLALPDNATVSHRLCFREETQRARKCRHCASTTSGCQATAGCGGPDDSAHLEIMQHHQKRNTKTTAVGSKSLLEHIDGVLLSSVQARISTSATSVIAVIITLVVVILRWTAAMMVPSPLSCCRVWVMVVVANVRRRW